MIIENDGGDKGSAAGYGLEEYFVQEDDDSYSSGGKRKRGKKGRRKKNKKGSKKIYKKMAPVFIGLGGLKLVLYHLFLKKIAFFSFFSFLLSKASFILASLVALKQFFHAPTQHRSSESNKLEVVHIPIRKFRNNKDNKDKDSYYDESKFIPITFAPETVFDTTPFYNNFPYNENNPETFASSEENANGNFDGKFNDQFGEDWNGKFEDFKFDDWDGKFGDTLKTKQGNKLNGKFQQDFKDFTDEDGGKFKDIYNEHFDDNVDRSDGNVEKNFYKNHVQSPFV